MNRNIIFAPIPKTQLTFVNVPLVPVRTRAGETRYLCATWGGAMHLFDRHGNEKVIAYPEGGQGAYSFVAAVEDGFAWAVHTGGKITLIDVDAGEYALVQDVPLKVINWGATITREGYLVCEASPGDILIYDTTGRKVKQMITPISHDNHYAHYLRAAPDGCVIVPIGTPGAELIRLDPRTGEYQSACPPLIRDDMSFPKSVTVLPDGRFAIPRDTHVDTVTYPDFEDAPRLQYPEEQNGWETFRDYGDGRLFAYSRAGGPLYALNGACEWELHLETFAPRMGWAKPGMFCALPERRLLGLSLFGEIVEYQPDGTERLVAELNNYGYQRFGDLEPGDGAQVFTCSFINMSFQELDYRTGRGRNVRPCQEEAGQVNHMVWLHDKLWLACYGGAEITAYDPKAPGKWPTNPRPAAKFGEEQMRPTGLCSDGSFLWCVTRAQYGRLGGALERFDPQTETCKVWRNLVPDHNLTGLIFDAERSRVYAGTTIHADCQSAPPAEGPAAVLAFDAEREEMAWISRPVEDAATLSVAAAVSGSLMVLGGDPRQILLLSLDDGKLRESLPLQFPEHWTGYEFFMGGDGKLHVASPEDGVFLYDPEYGVGEQIIEGPVLKPRVRGKDFFFIRGNEVGVIEGLWRS